MLHRRRALGGTLAAAVIVTVACAGPVCAALTAQEVLVVANSNSADSVDLARFYAKARGIPEQNVLLLKTSTEYEISQADYEAQVRRPLREFLTRQKMNEGIRCVCLMWGVPVRIGDDLLNVYGAAGTKAHYRLAIGRKLLATVGKDFPAPKTADLRPLGALFSGPVPVPDAPLAKPEDLRKEISRLLAEKLAETAKIADPSKRQLASRQLMALYLDVYGLKGLIGSLGDSKLSGGPKVEDLKAQLTQVERKLADLAKSPATLESAKVRLDLIDEIAGASGVLSAADEVKLLKPADAALDSELALLWSDDYPLAGKVSNPLYWRAEAPAKKLAPTLLTARIDGPTHADAMRIIKGSLAAEKAGLKGLFYIDAGGPDRVKQYDENLRQLRRFLLSNTKMKAIMDDEKDVFPPRSCPDAALYVGWYSAQKYVPAFIWETGAVGWHISSFEAMHLRDGDSQEWCPKMIQNGVVATIGAVNEPYLGAFPLPQDFYALLLTGKYTVAECYFRTVPWLSWRLTFIADPLYNPFAASPQADVEKLPKGLAP